MDNQTQLINKQPFRLLRLCRWLEFSALIPGASRWFKKFVLRGFKKSTGVDIGAGFKCLYGNIVAEKNVSLSDTYCIDYADIIIGEGTGFSFQNMIITSSHQSGNFNGQITARPVTIGKNCWITSRCLILPGVTIGDNVIIAAGSIVKDDIPSDCLAAGNPCRPIKENINHGN